MDEDADAAIAAGAVSRKNNESSSSGNNAKRSPRIVLDFCNSALYLLPSVGDVPVSEQRMAAFRVQVPSS